MQVRMPVSQTAAPRHHCCSATANTPAHRHNSTCPAPTSTETTPFLQPRHMIFCLRAGFQLLRQSSRNQATQTIFIPPCTSLGGPVGLAPEEARRINARDSAPAISQNKSEMRSLSAVAAGLAHHHAIRLASGSFFGGLLSLLQAHLAAERSPECSAGIHD